MPKAEGKRYEFQSQDAIDAGVLEALPYEGGRQNIIIESAEFSAVCPFSGLPDYGEFIIEYIPDKSIVELKALKYYIISFRNVGIYQEDAINRIFNDLTELLDPQWFKIALIYNTRGGMDTTCMMET